MLAFGPEVQSSIPGIGSSFPMEKAAEIDGSFGKDDEDDGGGSTKDDEEEEEEKEGEEEKEEESTSPHVDDAGRRTHCRHRVFCFQTRRSTRRKGSPTEGSD